MPGRGVRLVRSSVLLYGVIVWRLFVSAGYVVIVARRLSVQDFALIGLVMAFSRVFQWPTQVWLYWAQRLVVREEGERRAALTGLAVTLLYLLLVLPLFILLSYIEYKVLGYGFRELLTAAPYILIIPINISLSSFTGVTFPEFIAYTRFISDTTRIIVAFVLITILGWRYDGAILSLFLSVLVSLTMLTAVLYKKSILSGRIDWSLAKSWFKAFYTPTLKAMVGIIRFLTRPFISWTTHNPVAIAYLHVGLSGESPLVQASSFSAEPLYSRMLRSPDPDDLMLSLALYFLFTGFLVTAFIGLSHPIATAYNPLYKDAWVAITGVAVYAFFYGLANIYTYALTALDESDRRAPPVGRGTLMARVLEVSLGLLALAYIFSTPLTWATRRVPQESVTLFLSLLSVASIAQVVVFHRWLKRRLNYKLPWREVLGVLLGGSLSMIYYWVSGAYSLTILKFSRDIWQLLIHLIASGVIFYIIVLIVSPLARRLVRRSLVIVGLVEGPSGE